MAYPMTWIPYAWRTSGFPKVGRLIGADDHGFPKRRREVGCGEEAGAGVPPFNPVFPLSRRDPAGRVQRQETQIVQSRLTLDDFRP